MSWWWWFGSNAGVSGRVIVNSGISYLLDVGIGTGTHITGWYLGLIATGGLVSSGNSLASHENWTEFSGYTGGNRPKWSPNAVSGKTIDANTNYTIAGGPTALAGAFLCSVASGGSAGDSLFAVGVGLDRSGLQDGDVLTVRAIFSCADDGV